MLASWESSSSLSESQCKQYKILKSLQTLVQNLPRSLQQRLSLALLSDLAYCLLDPTIFTIVDDLEEIQHLNEKNLFAQRQKLVASHTELKKNLRLKTRESLQQCRPHNKSIMMQQVEKQQKDLNDKLQNELADMDKRLLAEFDDKVLMQQTTLQGAGVPSFFVTSNPQDVNLQMTILHLIKELKV